MCKTFTHSLLSCNWKQGHRVAYMSSSVIFCSWPGVLAKSLVICHKILCSLATFSEMRAPEETPCMQKSLNNPGALIVTALQFHKWLLVIRCRSVLAIIASVLEVEPA